MAFWPGCIGLEVSGGVGSNAQLDPMGLTDRTLCDWVLGFPRSSGCLRRESLPFEIFATSSNADAAVGHADDEEPSMTATCNQEGKRL